MVLPTQGHYLFSPRDTLLPSLTSRRNSVKSPQSLVSAKPTREAAVGCLHWKGSWPLSRYATDCPSIRFWLHIPQKLFDTLMMSANYVPNHAQTQSPQKESRSLISHLLHIAASPPDNAQRPHCNILQHLDFVNWDSIPVELKKVSGVFWLTLVRIGTNT